MIIGTWIVIGVCVVGLFAVVLRILMRRDTKSTSTASDIIDAFDYGASGSALYAMRAQVTGVSRVTAFMILIAGFGFLLGGFALLYLYYKTTTLDLLLLGVGTVIFGLGAVLRISISLLRATQEKKSRVMIINRSNAPMWTPITYSLIIIGAIFWLIGVAVGRINYDGYSVIGAIAVVIIPLIIVGSISYYRIRHDKT